MDIDEYITETGPLYKLEDRIKINNLERVLNKYARMGYEFVTLNQYVWDGQYFTLVMKRRVQ